MSNHQKRRTVMLSLTRVAFDVASNALVACVAVSPLYFTARNLTIGDVLNAIVAIELWKAVLAIAVIVGFVDAITKQIWRALDR
jgi:hypothetical protein